jgi:subtilase family serine protease
VLTAVQSRSSRYAQTGPAASEGIACLLVKTRVVPACLAAGVMLLSASGCSSQAASAIARPPARAGGPAGDCLSTASCYTPRQIRVADGFQPLLDRRIDGRRQTVVLPELAQQRPSPPSVTDIRQDLALFDRRFGLPAPHLRVVTTLAGTASPWLAAPEEVEDTEIVHAIAPDAAIRVILVKAADWATAKSRTTALIAVLRLGLSASVISVSAGTGEHCLTAAEVTGLHAELQQARDHHVTVVAASGDYGAVSKPCPGAGAAAAPVREVSLPASDPLVLAAGGTNLRASHRTGAYISETALTTSVTAGHSYASGGGFSHLFTRPAYQRGVTGIKPATRGVPDVAADASGNTGMALAITARGRTILTSASGTSAAAPLWAALIALADQYAGRRLGFVNPALYRIARSTSYHHAFHDVTTGTNTITIAGKTISGYRAAPGWDPVTGWGSPNARTLIPLLTRYASP